MSEIIAAEDVDDVANASALRLFAKLDPSLIAFMLDVDGTLIDIGPSPFEVNVPESLKETLVKLYELSGGALALVSGRPIRDLDLLFAPLKLPSVGGHGAEQRLSGASVSRVENLPEAMRHHLITVATPGSGIEYEDKGYSVALHFRKALHEEARLRAHVEETRRAFPTVDTEVLPGKAMFEVKSPGINKGDGVRALMAKPPFEGRSPVFIGDDVTDEAAFGAMPEFGGLAFSVGFRFEDAAGMFSEPEQVRLALRRMAGL